MPQVLQLRFLSQPRSTWPPAYRWTVVMFETLPVDQAGLSADAVLSHLRRQRFDLDLAQVENILGNLNEAGMIKRAAGSGVQFVSATVRSAAPRAVAPRLIVNETSAPRPSASPMTQTPIDDEPPPKAPRKRNKKSPEPEVSSARRIDSVLAWELIQQNAGSIENNNHEGWFIGDEQFWKWESEIEAGFFKRACSTLSKPRSLSKTPLLERKTLSKGSYFDYVYRRAKQAGKPS